MCSEILSFACFVCVLNRTSYIKGMNMDWGCWGRCLGLWDWEWHEVREKVHNEELSGVHSSLNAIRVMKSRRMRWMGNVVWMRQHAEFWWNNSWKTQTVSKWIVRSILWGVTCHGWRRSHSASQIFFFMS